MNKEKRYWKGKTPEEILSILNNVLEEKVKVGEITKVKDLKVYDSGLWAALKKYTPYGPSGCFRILGYDHLIKSDKRKGIKNLQEQLGNRPLKVLESETRLVKERPRTYIRFECTVEGCGYKSSWKAFNNIKRGTGCSRCSGREPITNEIHDQRLESYYKGKISRVESIKNAKEKIQHLCNVCGHRWASPPKSIAPKPSQNAEPRGCPNCAGKIPLTNTEYDKRLIHHHKGSIQRCAEIIDSRTPILHKCLICQETFLMEPYNIAPRIDSSTDARSCPNCSGRAKSTNDRHDKRLLYWHGKKIVRIGEVKKADVPILHKCNLHDHVWNVSPNHIAPPIKKENIVKPTRCPICSDVRSGMGLEVQKILGQILTMINREIIAGVNDEVKAKSKLDGYVRGIEPDYSLGNVFIDSKLSLGAVFSKDNKTSHEKYSPYGKVINIVFEPWENMNSRVAVRGQYNILHVSALLSVISNNKIHKSFIEQIEKVLLIDRHNIENGVIELFKNSCKQGYFNFDLTELEERMLSKIILKGK